MRKIIYLLFVILFSACGKNNSESLAQADSASIIKDEPGAQVSNAVNDSSEAIADDEDVMPMSGERNLASVDLSGDSLITINAYMKLDHQIFGYAQTDTTSEKLIVLSVFTYDVKDNPHHCKLGAYYDTGGMNFNLKFTGVKGDFVEALAFGETVPPTTVYFKKEWIAY